MRQSFDTRSRLNKKLLPQEHRRRELAETPKPRKFETRIIFLCALALNLSAAILCHFFWKIGSVEAFSLTGKGFYFLFAGESKLAEILLTDPPLPSLLQIVIIPILRLFGISSFAGPLLSVIFGALALIILNRILLMLRLPERYRWLFLGLTQCFPSYLYAAAVGAVEILYVFIILVVIYGALQIRRNQMAFLICGFGLTFGFLIQYEIISLILGVAIALIIFKWKVNEGWQAELEGWMLAYLIPPIYGIMLWIILNWLNVNTPFYFLENLFDPDHAATIARNVGILHPYFLGWDHFFESLVITGNRFWQTSFAFIIGIFLTIYLAARNKKRHYISVLVMMLSIPTMQVFKIFFGVMSPWLYKWVYLIPFGAILAGMFYQDLKPLRRDVLMVLMVVLTIISILLNFNALGENDVAVGEQRIHALLTGDLEEEKYLRQFDPYWVYQYDAVIVAEALDQFSVNGNILVDSNYAAPIAMAMESPKHLVLVEYLDMDTFYSPIVDEVTYVIVLQMDESLNTSMIPYSYPPLSDEVAWVTEVWSSDQTILNWRLFRIETGCTSEPRSFGRSPERIPT